MMVAALLGMLVSLEVPFVAQPKDGCGAAALAMVLRRWDEPADVAAIASALVDPELRAIRGSRLEAYARGLGFVAIAHQGDLQSLAAHLEKGRPLIVAWKLKRGFHDVVVVGIDERAVTVHDPAEGPSRSVALAEFERRWAGSGRWTLLVLPGEP